MDAFGEIMSIFEKIKKQIDDNAVFLYMKGTPENPQCGFSARAVQCLEDCGAVFNYVDVLSNPYIRQALPQYSNWPTFPQLYVNGELVGGSDIITEMHQNGELAELLESVKVN